MRGRTGLEIPLAWNAPPAAAVSAIEVYPAATLVVYDLKSTDYKKRNDSSVRQTMLERLANFMFLPEDSTPLTANSDILDAAICTLAASDFLRGHALAPTDMARARKEGWIWVRQHAPGVDWPDMSFASSIEGMK